MRCVAGKVEDVPMAESEMLPLIGVTEYSGKAGNSGTLPSSGLYARGMSR